MTLRYTPEQVAAAVTRARGIKSVAAASLRCSSSTISRYIARFPEVREAFEQAKGLLVDRAELQLMDAVDKGIWKAGHYTLVTLGKDRGYVEGGDARVRPEEEVEEASREFIATLLKVYGGPEGESDDEDEEDADFPEPMTEPGEWDGDGGGDGETERE
jgi:hypothetical protein